MEGDSLTATALAISAGSGTLVDNGDGTWDYTPAANDDTGVSFTYTVSDGTDTVAGSATLDGAETAEIGSVSLACLSCHDGTQAMDVVINGPGSGNYNPNGSEIDPVAIGVMTGAPVPMLGQDLTNDHPISMQYGGGGATVADANGTFTGTLGDPDFVPPEKATINGQPIWWVNSNVGTAAREKTDMLLYTRNDLGVQEPFVECGSCHDPHNAASQGTGSVAFLRTSNAASAVCVACHTK